MKKPVIAVAIIAVVAAVAYFGLSRTDQGGEITANLAATAPISGSVQNFTILPEPVPAPAIAFETETGEAVTMADLEGGLVLVNFWATFCGPCIRELPSLEALAAEFADDGLTVALLSQDHAGWEQINVYLTRLNISTPDSYLDVAKKFAGALGVSSLPVTALIDTNGNIVGAVTGPAEWDTPEAFALIRHFL